MAGHTGSQVEHRPLSCSARAVDTGRLHFKRTLLNRKCMYEHVYTFFRRIRPPSHDAVVSPLFFLPSFVRSCICARVLPFFSLILGERWTISRVVVVVAVIPCPCLSCEVGYARYHF